MSGSLVLVLVIAWLGSSPDAAERRPDARSPANARVETDPRDAEPAEAAAPGSAPADDASVGESRRLVVTKPKRAMPRPTVVHVGPLRTTAPFHGVVLDGEH